MVDIYRYEPSMSNKKFLTLPLLPFLPLFVGEEADRLFDGDPVLDASLWTFVKPEIIDSVIAINKIL